MEIVFKYFWIILIIVTLINGFILKTRFKKYSDEKPELKIGYDKYLKGYLIFGNIPWVIMMIGSLSGMTESMNDYFNPKAMNPIVLIFHASIVILWILSIRWIYFKKGAEFIEMHPGLTRKSSISGNTDLTAKQVKLLFPLMLLGGIIGLTMMWVSDIAIPI